MLEKFIALNIDKLLPMDPTISIQAIKNNQTVVSKMRAYSSLLAGIAAGILGLTSIAGIVFYIVVSLFMSLCLYTKAKISNDRKGNGVLEDFGIGLFDQISGNISSFLLFWVFAYGIVHVYE